LLIPFGFFFHFHGDVINAGEGLHNRISGPSSREKSLSCHTCCDKQTKKQNQKKKKTQTNKKQNKQTKQSKNKQTGK
jgi:hypothetical protein